MTSRLLKTCFQARLVATAGCHSWLVQQCEVGTRHPLLGKTSSGTRISKHVLCLACLLAIVLALPVQAADPVLNQLKPQGGQRGTEVEVLFLGQRVGDGPFQILSYEPGIEVRQLEAVDGKKLRCLLALAADCQLGEHALRLRTASGLSNLVTFHVSNLLEIQEAEPNNTSAQPQKISTDVVVNGLVNSGDVDVYAVELAAGERLSVEIEGIRLGRTLFDPVIQLHNQAGKLLASSDDQTAAGQDAFVSLRAAQAETVFLRVREAAYRGNNAATYRLHVGRFPRPTTLFPPVAVPGKTTEFKWLGDALDGLQKNMPLPQTDQEIYDLHAQDDQGISPTSLPLYLSSTSPLTESEPNNRVSEANQLAVPGIACGIISTAKDKDFYRFSLKQGEQWDFRVRARQLRSPLDATLHLYDGKGKYLKGNDDNAGQPDSYLRFKAPADGEYVLDVEDRLLRGRSDMVYVVEITRPEPLVELQLDERRRYQSQVINIPQGGRTAAMMTVKRKDVGGALQVEWNDLPAGSTAEAVPLAGNYNRVPVLFTAEPQAELGATLAAVTTKHIEKPQPLTSRFRQQSWLVRGRNNVAVWSHFAQRAAVAVTQALPYSVRVAEPQAPLVQGGSMQLKIVADRQAGFEKAIAVRTLYNPPGVATNQSRSIGKNKNEVLIPITASAKARPGNWRIIFLGKTSIGGAVETATQLATLRVVEPYFDIKLPALAATQGEHIKLQVTLEHRSPFTGEAELELVRLPPGVTASKIKVQAGQKLAAFELHVAGDARVSRHRGVGCAVLLTVADEPVRYSQGYVDLHIDPAPSKKQPKTAAHQQQPEGQTS